MSSCFTLNLLLRLGSLYSAHKHDSCTLYVEGMRDAVALLVGYGVVGGQVSSWRASEKLATASLVIGYLSQQKCGNKGK
jgi:hypothetical protein